MSEFVVPDLAEPVVGWRAWWVTEDGRLLSLFNGDVWPAGAPCEAACGERCCCDHDAPLPRGSVGWAVAIVFTLALIVAFMLGPDRGLWLYIHGAGAAALFLAGALHTLVIWNVLSSRRCSGCPCERGTCGIYALSEFDHAAVYALAQAQSFSGSRPVAGMAFGSVRLWGKLRLGERGYRAQYAYPRELWLWLIDGGEELVEAVGERYGVTTRPDPISALLRPASAVYPLQWRR